MDKKAATEIQRLRSALDSACASLVEAENRFREIDGQHKKAADKLREARSKVQYAKAALKAVSAPDQRIRNRRLVAERAADRAAARDARNARIVALRSQGLTYPEIGRQCKVTAERARMIVEKDKRKKASQAILAKRNNC